MKRGVQREIEQLFEKTARTRYEFLKAGMQACFTALEMAQYELSVGHVDGVRKEIAFVRRGIATLRRFLSEASSEQRSEVAAGMARLQGLLTALNTELEVGQVGNLRRVGSPPKAR